jgi:hypothetical protein
MGNLIINPLPARQFLTAIYAHFFSQAHDPAYLEVRGKREGKGMSFRRFYPNPGALLKDMAAWQPGLNYWLGVALRKDSMGGAKVNLLALTAAFADVDVGTAGHKAASTYETKAEALAAIEAFPLRPTILIDSGGGYQSYWRFREPVHLAAAGGGTHPTIAQLEAINRGLSLALGGDVAATDAARILRLPGNLQHEVDRPAPARGSCLVRA